MNNNQESKMKTTTGMQCPKTHDTGAKCDGCEQCRTPLEAVLASMHAKLHIIYDPHTAIMCELANAQRLAAAASLAASAAQPAPDWTVGNLLTLSDYDYPGMGQFFAQVWQGDVLIARVYGDNADEVRSRAARLAAPAAAAVQPKPVFWYDPTAKFELIGALGGKDQIAKITGAPNGPYAQFTAPLFAALVAAEVPEVSAATRDVLAERARQISVSTLR